MKRPREPLPDPEFASIPPWCLRCGFDITGIGAPGRCPECGLPFEEQSLIVSGVAKQIANSMPVWRRVLWILASCFAFLTVQCAGLLILAGPIYLLMLGAVAIGLFVFLMTTGGKREARGAERFVLTPGGIGKIPIKDDAGATTVFIPWDGPMHAELRQVGSVWARLVIRDQYSKRLFEAGIRCPRELAPVVVEAIEVLTSTPGTAAGDRPDYQVP